MTSDFSWGAEETVLLVSLYFLGKTWGTGWRLTPEVIVSEFYVMTSLVVNLTKDTTLYIQYRNVRLHGY